MITVDGEFLIGREAPYRIPIKQMPGWHIEVYLAPDHDGIVADIALIDPNGDRHAGAAIDIFHADDHGEIGVLVDGGGDPVAMLITELMVKEDPLGSERVWLDDSAVVGGWYGEGAAHD
jgi:hypothetical protein